MDDVQKIRRLLDERGVDYDEHSSNFNHKFLFDYCEACADYLSEIEIFGGCICATKNYLTPEQAIVATLGSGENEFKIDINEMVLINEYAKKVERVIDAEMLKRVEHRLNEFGYYRAFGQCKDLSDTWDIFLCSNCHARITVDPGDRYDANDFKVCPICRCEVVNHD